MELLITRVTSVHIMNSGDTQQVPEGQQKQKTYVKMREEADLSIEVVLLLVVGLFFFLLGLLLIGAFAGALLYSEDGSGWVYPRARLSLHYHDGQDPVR